LPYKSPSLVGEKEAAVIRQYTDSTWAFSSLRLDRCLPSGCVLISRNLYETCLEPNIAEQFSCLAAGFVYQKAFTGVCTGRFSTKNSINAEKACGYKFRSALTAPGSRKCFPVNSPTSTVNFDL